MIIIEFDVDILDYFKIILKLLFYWMCIFLVKDVENRKKILIFKLMLKCFS